MKNSHTKCGYFFIIYFVFLILAHQGKNKFSNQRFLPLNDLLLDHLQSSMVAHIDYQLDSSEYALIWVCWVYGYELDVMRNIDQR